MDHDYVLVMSDAKLTIDGGPCVGVKDVVDWMFEVWEIEADYEIDSRRFTVSTGQTTPVDLVVIAT